MSSVRLGGTIPACVIALHERDDGLRRLPGLVVEGLIGLFAEPYPAGSGLRELCLIPVIGA
jgi:hypothetical protein